MNRKWGTLALFLGGMLVILVSCGKKAPPALPDMKPASGLEMPALKNLKSKIDHQKSKIDHSQRHAPFSV